MNPLTTKIVEAEKQSDLPCYCDEPRCRINYNVDLLIPDSLWKDVVRFYKSRYTPAPKIELLCPACIGYAIEFVYREKNRHEAFKLAAIDKVLEGEKKDGLIEIKEKDFNTIWQLNSWLEENTLSANIINIQVGAFNQSGYTVFYYSIAPPK